MKITFKDPDGVGDAIQEEAEKQLEEIKNKLDESEYESLLEERKEKIEKKLEKWIKYNEYLTVEFDLKNLKAMVIEEK
jgi:hypothetical protein